MYLRVRRKTAIINLAEQIMIEKIIQARLVMSIKDRKLSEDYANELDKFGFKIVKISQRGISFAGNVNLFERVFASEIEVTAAGVKFRKEPTMPGKIEKHVDSLYFPTKPIFF
jgi:hypothetical protein